MLHPETQRFLTSRRMRVLVLGALKAQIHDHGPIQQSQLDSVWKRLKGQVEGYLKSNYTAYELNYHRQEGRWPGEAPVRDKENDAS